MKYDRILSERFQIDRRQILWFLLALTISGFLLRIMIGYAAVHHYDLNYYVDWSSGVNGGLFRAYEQIKSLDYPPLFLFPLTITGKLMALPIVSEIPGLEMLLLKGWQILFDTATIPLIYLVLYRQSRLIAAAGAALWAVNPTIIVNSSYWGQTDSIMLFLLVLSFWLLIQQKPVISAVIMTLACLMKFQSLYFAPVFGLFLITKFSWKKIGYSILAGILTALTVFMPFIAYSGWMLPFEIYFGGFEQYQSASLNAFNYFTACGLNMQNSGETLIGGLSAEMLSAAILVISVFLLGFLYFTSTEKSPWLLSFLFIQTIFMFTTRMHERYQIPAVIFSLIACLHHRSKGLFVSYLSLTCVTFLNHVLVLEHMLNGRFIGFWVERFENIFLMLSYVNLFLYMMTIYFSVRLLYRYGHFRFFSALKCALPAEWRNYKPNFKNR